MNATAPILLCFSGLLQAGTACAEATQESAEVWYRQGAERADRLGSGKAEARNVILFIGDGMSLTTVAAARIFEGQQHGRPGEENQLSFEKYPATAFSKAYNTDSQTPDSAGTMTAMSTGAKTRMGFLSVGQIPDRGQCAQSLKHPLTSAMTLAKAAGLSTGVVTTTRITHATPAATYAHSPERNWESDADMSDAAKAQGCSDIAQQLVDYSAATGVDVVMGGGLNKFLPAGANPKYPDAKGARSDGKDLVKQWASQEPGRAFVFSGSQLAALDLTASRKITGLFSGDHMDYEFDRVTEKSDQPSLAEMTRAAINMLKRADKGFFLVVEGGRIDHAHHSGIAYRALTDTVAFAEAVEAANALTSEQDTLILVTADHSHTMSFVGYPQRGNPILGKVVGVSSEDDEPGLVKDLLGLPYTTLVYANGPGYTGATSAQPAGSKNFPHNPGGYVEPAVGRPDLTKVDTQHPNFMQEALVPSNSESHGGDDVGIWARGPGSAAVRGSLEQNTLFHLLTQPQPLIRRYLCDSGYCENGLPVLLPRVK